MKDETADRVDDGRALRAISLFSTRAMTSFTGFLKNVRGPKNFTADVWVGYPIEEDISYDMVCVVDVFPTLTYCGEGTGFWFPTSLS